MVSLSTPLAGLAAFNQFLPITLYRPAGVDKIIKLPIGLDGRAVDPTDPTNWMSAEQAFNLANRNGWLVGFFLTENDPYFLLDIDDCNQDGQWSQVAQNMMARFPGAAIEVSQSNTGLHIIGRCPEPIRHGTRYNQDGLELYSHNRMITLGHSATGSVDTDHSAAFNALAAELFPPKNTGERPEEWTDQPHPDYRFDGTDEELIEKALASGSDASKLGAAPTFRDLWEHTEKAVNHYHGDSEADSALAMSLMFWTGLNCEHVERLMWESPAKRDKWETHSSYLKRTISNAYANYSGKIFGQDQATTEAAAAKTDTSWPMGGGSKHQNAQARVIRDGLYQQCTPEQQEQLRNAPGRARNARFWLNNEHETPAVILKKCLPAPTISAFNNVSAEPTLKTGYQFLDVNGQLELFRGCVYITSANAIALPTGQVLPQDRFNCIFGGYTFALDTDANGRQTRSPWEAFNQSEAIAWPRVEMAALNPLEPPGSVYYDQVTQKVCYNTYRPNIIETEEGDITPFLEHMRKLVPVERDREILLAYMAALVQHVGVKFQWAPVVQGTEGNGKTLFSRAVAYAIGQAYTFWPRRDELESNHNKWLFDNLFVSFEDIYVPERRKDLMEKLKPMITNEYQTCREMQTDGVNRRCFVNMILNTNHKDGVRVHRNSRRYSVFYTAQQSKADLLRDGLTDAYFVQLYKWLAEVGYKRVAHFLQTYEIPDKYNPAVGCVTAPLTSSSKQAVTESLGMLEQQALRAIEEGVQGFRGGFISSVQLHALYDRLRLAGQFKPNRAAFIMANIDYVPHPALPEGKLGRPTELDGKRPRLYVHIEHPAAELKTATEVADAYERAQRALTETPHQPPRLVQAQA